MKIISILSIIVLFHTADTFGQVNFSDIVKEVNKKKCLTPITTKTYISQSEGWCRSIINLNSDSTFMDDFGCESQASILIGKWKVIGDSIELISSPQDSLNLVCEIKIINPKTSGKTKFTVIDKSGFPYPSFQFSLFNNKTSLLDTISSFYTPATEKVFTTDSVGIVTFKHKGFKYIELPAFSVLQGSRFVINTRDLPEEIRIQVNFNSFLSPFGEVKYDTFKKPLRFKYSETKLIRDKYILIAE